MTNETQNICTCGHKAWIHHKGYCSNSNPILKTKCPCKKFEQKKQTEKMICPYCKRKAKWISMLKRNCDRKDCKLKQKGKN